MAPCHDSDGNLQKWDAKGSSLSCLVFGGVDAAPKIYIGHCIFWFLGREHHRPAQLPRVALCRSFAFPLLTSIFMELVYYDYCAGYPDAFLTSLTDSQPKQVGSPHDWLGLELFFSGWLRTHLMPTFALLRLPGPSSA